MVVRGILRVLIRRWLPGLGVSLLLCWLLGVLLVQGLTGYLPALDALLWAQLMQLVWLLVCGVLLQSHLSGRFLLCSGAAVALLAVVGLVVLKGVNGSVAALTSHTLLVGVC